MIDVILLTGFLGAGKTTLLQTLLTANSGKKIGVIVNEFGEINVDAKLLRGEGIQMAELSNGSIFCACIKDKFVDGLIEMSCKDLDCLFIEASGLADPANMEGILEGIRPKMLHELRLLASLCVLDAVRFAKLVNVLPALENQLRYADAVIVNKADLVDEAALLEISKIVEDFNPGVGMFVTSYCRIDLNEVLSQLKQERKASGETTNTRESRPNTFVLRTEQTLELERLRQFVAAIAPESYRIKGFANTDRGVMEISAVMEDVRITDWPDPIAQTEIVVISAVGMSMVSRIVENSNRYLDGKLQM